MITRGFTNNTIMTRGLGSTIAQVIRMLVLRATSRMHTIIAARSKV